MQSAKAMLWGFLGFACLFVLPGAACAWVQVGASQTGSSVGARLGISIALAADGTRLLAGEPLWSGNRGGVLGYLGTGTSWNTWTTPVGPAGTGQWGTSIATSADASILAVGAPSLGYGRVDVFRHDGTSWSPRGTAIEAIGSGDREGSAVALSADGTVLAVGANQATVGAIPQAGRVRVFAWDGSDWIQRGAALAGPMGGSGFGGSLALSADGSILAVGAIYAGGISSDAGTVQVHAWNGTGWEQRGASIVGQASQDNLGWSVDLSADGSVVAVGTPGSDAHLGNAGGARVLAWTDGAWVQRGGDLHGENFGDGAGSAVSLSSDGTVVAVGAEGNDGVASGAGHVRVHTWDGSAWTQRDGDIDGSSANDHVGYSVSLSADGSLVAVGAPGDPASQAGRAVVYASPPATPGTPVATSLSGARARLVFTEDPVAGSAEATCTSTDGGGTAVASGSGSPLVVPGLTPASTYTCVVRSFSAAGSTAASSASASFGSGYALAVSIADGSGAVVDDGGVIDCGSVCTGTAAADGTVILTAVPASGWAFAGWGGACAGATLTCTVTMTAARSATASFVLRPSDSSSSLLGEAPAAVSGGAAAPEAPATPTRIRWSKAVRGRPVTARFTGEAGVGYAIAARTRGAGSVRGSCRPAGAAITCTLRLRKKGLWQVTITPGRAGVAGTPAQRVLRVR